MAFWLCGWSHPRNTIQSSRRVLQPAPRAMPAPRWSAQLGGSAGRASERPQGRRGELCAPRAPRAPALLPRCLPRCPAPGPGFEKAEIISEFSVAGVYGGLWDSTGCGCLFIYFYEMFRNSSSSELWRCRCPVWEAVRAEKRFLKLPFVLVCIVILSLKGC